MSFPRPTARTAIATAVPAALLAAGLLALGALPRAVGATPVADGACIDARSYYAFDLVPTARVPGTAGSGGEVEVRFEPSPYGVSLAEDGSYLLHLTLLLEGLPARATGEWVAWVTTTEVDRIERLGVVRDGRVEGRARWNKFLVVITLETDDDPAATTWSGPIVLRGMSRSGMMHTMAGHGAFQQENCAAYGYD